MNDRDIDPKVRRFFPWALFLFLAALCFWGAITTAHGEQDIWACYGSARYQAMSAGWTPCNEMSKMCVKVREYLAQGHTPEEGLALAKANNVPQWIINKAEKCIP